MEIDFEKAYSEEMRRLILEIRANEDTIHKLQARLEQQIEHTRKIDHELSTLKKLIKEIDAGYIGTRYSERFESKTCEYCKAHKNLYQFGDVEHTEDCPVTKIVQAVWDSHK